MLFELNNFIYSYGRNNRFQLGPLSLTLESDSITALVGSNGSGKTTLIRILLNELLQYGGDYTIDSVPVNDMSGSVPHTYGIGYAPEEPVLDERLSGYEIAYIVKEIHNIKKQEFDIFMAQFRQLLQIGSWFETSPCREYSQGMRRKVSLLAAFLGAYNYLIIDEPTNGLDPVAVFGVKKLLLSYKEQGKGVLVSSHILDFVEKIAQNVIILKNGTVAFAGKVQELLDSHPGMQLDEIYYNIFVNIPENSGLSL